MARLVGLLFLALLCVVSTSRVAAEIRLNEVLYDPPGADGDGEFVELFVIGSAGVDLDGVELWFINGDAVDSPRVVWTAPTGIRLNSGAWYVIGEESVVARDATARLDLQNGPDALWLVRSGAVIDRLAWGEGARPAAEGNPAEDVSGLSLGRVPDGADTDDNGADWVALEEPNPGGRNREPVDFEWGDLGIAPSWLPGPGPGTLSFTLRASGFSARHSGAWSCCGTDVLTPFSLSLGETLHASVPVALPPGRSVWRVEVWSEQGETIEERAVHHQVGPASVALNEIQPRPQTGEPEWIELRNGSDRSVDLAAWGWRDRGGETRIFGAGAFLEPGARLLLCEDPASLRAVHPVPADVEVLRPSDGWATLNDTADAEGIADTVELIDDQGVVVDRVPLLARDFEERGRSLERVKISASTPSLWLPCPVGQTAGSPNASSPRRFPESGLRLEPNPFTPDGDGEEDALRVILRADRIADSLEAEVLDLGGDRVRTLRGAGNDGIHQWLWDGRDAAGRRVPLGAYVVVVRDRENGGVVRTWRALVAVGRRS